MSRAVCFPQAQLQATPGSWHSTAQADGEGRVSTNLPQSGLFFQINLCSQLFKTSFWHVGDRWECGDEGEAVRGGGDGGDHICWVSLWDQALHRERDQTSQGVLAAQHPDPGAGIIPWGLSPSLKSPSVKNQWKITCVEGLVSPPHLPCKAELGSSAAPARIKPPRKCLWMIQTRQFCGFGGLREPGSSRAGQAGP